MKNSKFGDWKYVVTDPDDPEGFRLSVGNYVFNGFVLYRSRHGSEPSWYLDT